MNLDDVPAPWYALVGLLVLPAIGAFVFLEPVAAITVVNVLIITVAVRIMFDSSDLEYLPFGSDETR